MSDPNIKTMDDGSRWLPASSYDKITCASCSNEVDTPAEVASYPSGNCPQCNNPWLGSEKRDTTVSVTAPEKIEGAS